MREPNDNLAAEIEAFLRERLGDDLRIVPFESQSAKVVFRAELASGRRLFVKLVRTSKGQMQKKLMDDIDLPFVAKIIHIFPWDETRSIICQEWQKGRHVKPEDMTVRQCASFIDSSLELQMRLRPCHAMLPVRDLESAYTTIADFARRHPLARPFLHTFLNLPREERTYPKDSLAVIHGDLHYENYLFDDDDISAIMDFEAVTTGLRTQDFAYTIIRRLFKARLAKAQRDHLRDLLVQMFAARDFSRLERIVAINMWRLVFAARRLASHPHFAPVAILVWKRDRPLQRLLRDICSCPSMDMNT